MQSMWSLVAQNVVGAVLAVAKSTGAVATCMLCWCWESAMILLLDVLGFIPAVVRSVLFAEFRILGLTVSPLIALEMQNPTLPTAVGVGVYSRPWIAFEWSECSGAKHIISVFDVAVSVGRVCNRSDGEVCYVNMCFVKGCEECGWYTWALGFEGRLLLCRTSRFYLVVTFWSVLRMEGCERGMPLQLKGLACDTSLQCNAFILMYLHAVLKLLT